LNGVVRIDDDSSSPIREAAKGGRKSGPFDGYKDYIFGSCLFTGAGRDARSYQLYKLLDAFWTTAVRHRGFNIFARQRLGDGTSNIPGPDYPDAWHIFLQYILTVRSIYIDTAIKTKDKCQQKLYWSVSMDSAAARLPRTDPDERRDHILRAARGAFLEDGFAATSMNGIANLVGGSKATLYYYFPTKEKLFTAAFTERTRDLDRVLFDEELEKKPIREALTILATRAVQWALNDDSVAIFRLITAESARFPEIGPAYYVAGPLVGKQLLAEFFGRAAQRGQIKPGSTMTMAITFIHACLGELQHRKLWNLGEPTGKEIDASVNNGVDVILAAYGT